MRERRHLSLIVDFYELTMANGYFDSPIGFQTVYFDVFFRNVPDGGGYAVVAGLAQIVDYLLHLRFDEADLDYLRSKQLFSESFLTYLQTFHFTGTLYAIPEGTIVFPGEPLLTIKATAIEAQLVETYLLLQINHQSLIATKAARIVRAAAGRTVMEFGTRRAQGVDAAIYGARAAYIGGVDATACTQAEVEFGIPAKGTMAHSWVQLFPSEYASFVRFAELYPHNVTLLVDTYNVLKSGVPNAIKAIQTILWPQGIRTCAIRIDSGDLAYLSIEARKLLDAAGLVECRIMVSNSLDEHRIAELIAQGAKIDGFGVGERLITAESDPIFGGVYKLVATESNGEIIPKIKVSENPDKIPTPHFKQIVRFYDRESGKALADLLTIRGESIDDTKALELFDPIFIWKRKTIDHFVAVPLVETILENGELIQPLPDLESIRLWHKAQLATIWEEVRRFENPHRYYVDLSQSLWNVKMQLLNTIQEAANPHD